MINLSAINIEFEPKAKVYYITANQTVAKTIVLSASLAFTQLDIILTYKLNTGAELYDFEIYETPNLAFEAMEAVE
jgi:hypothetical protein